jgi:Fe2+ transport system protein FeoA
MDRLTDLGLKDGSKIIVNSPILRESSNVSFKREIRDVGIQISRKPRVVGFNDEQIEQRVVRLTEFGFLRNDCEKALRAAAFNLDRAIDYLLSGNIPEPLVINCDRTNLE